MLKLGATALALRGAQGANTIVLRLLKKRAIEGRLPLLSVRQLDPFELQASHHSWQHYYTARAVRDSLQLQPPLPPPWEWDAWWASPVRFGASIGEPFRQGLLRTSGLERTDRIIRELDLRGKMITGNTRTAVAGVAQLVRTGVLKSLSVAGDLSADERAELCRATRHCTRLTAFKSDRISVDETIGTTLELGNWFEKCHVKQGGRPALDDTDISIFAKLIANGALPRVQTLWLACDEVGEKAMRELSEALSPRRAMPSLKALYVSKHGYVHVKSACRARKVQLSYPKDGMVEDAKDTARRIVRPAASWGPRKEESKI